MGQAGFKPALPLYKIRTDITFFISSALLKNSVRMAPNPYLSSITTYLKVSITATILRIDHFLALCLLLTDRTFV